MAYRLEEKLGNYRLVRLLGEGGFAQVYLGEHVFLKNQAAIKVLKGQVTEEELERFLNEAQTIARLKHPHIVSVLEFGVENKIPFLVMNYAPNGTLRQRHCEGSRLPLSTIVSYIEQIAPALQYAHNYKVIHRDIKPQNLLIGLNDEILLSDFGFAVVSESTSFQSTQNLAGTSAYMAPEQYKGKPRPASDQYALAVVVYEWLCGERPFRGNTLEIGMQHQFAAPPPLREKNPHISPALEQVVLKALAKDPKQRFTSVQAFATALQEACAAPTLINEPASPLAVSQPVALASVSPPPQPVMAPSTDTPSTLSPPSQQSARGTAIEGTTPSESERPPQFSLANTLLTRPIEQPPAPQRRLPKGYLLLALLGIALLLAMGSYTYLASSSSRQTVTPTATTDTTATMNTVPSATPATPYDVQVATHGIMFGFDAQHSHDNPYEHILNADNVSRLQQKWDSATAGLIFSSPAVANGLVYIGSYDGKLYAFDVNTGKLRWKAATGGTILSSSPAVANGLVYIGSDDGKLYAFDANTGTGTWAYATGSPIYSSPAVANGLVYVGSEDGKLYTFDANTGRLRWMARTSGLISSSPAVANGLVYIGSIDHKLYAFDANTGKLRWASLPAGAGISSSPAMADGFVYVGSVDHKLYAFDAGTGTLKWATATDASIDSSPAVANGLIYVGTNDHVLYAFDANTGKPRWASLPINDAVSPSSPEVADGLVYIGSIDHKLYAFDANTGAQRWASPPTGASIHSSPAVANGLVYIGSEDGKLYAFSLPQTTT